MSKDSQISKAWMDNYEKVKQRFIETGTIENFQYGSSLYQWISQNRSNYHKGKLTDKQVKLLNAVEMNWNKKRGLGEVHYKLFRVYKELYGDINYIPSGFVFKGYEYINLNNALMNIKAKYRNGKLSNEDIKRYEDLGIIWQQRIRANFDAHFAELLEFKNIHGHCNVSEQDTAASGFDLYAWCNRIRQSYENGTYDFTQEQFDRLKEIGFDFVRTKDNKWMEEYNRTKSLLKNVDFDFVKLYLQGHSDVIEWCYYRKKDYDSYPNWKKELLDKIFIHNAMSLGESAEEYKFRQVEKFYRKNGHIFVSKDYVDEDGCKIGYFLLGKRRGYWGEGGNIISEEDIERLDAMNMAWEGCAEKKKEFELNSVVLYLKNNGIVPIPKDATYNNINVWEKIDSIIKNAKNRNEDYVILCNAFQELDISLLNNNVLMLSKDELNKPFAKFLDALDRYVSLGGDITNINKRTMVDGYPLMA